MKKRFTLTSYFVKIFLPLFLLSVVLFSCQKKNEKTGPVYNSEYKQAILDSREGIKSYLFGGTVPGLSIAVSVDGQLVWSEGIGLASKELQVPASRETKFRIGNTSHMFTCYLIAKMQEKGMLDVNQSFYDYIPKFPKKKYDFTVKMLGADVSGLPEVTKTDLVKNKDLRTLKDFITKYENDTLLFKPGQYFMKSDYNYGLLGILAEELGGKRYQQLVNDMLLDTLHLDNTIIDHSNSIIPNRSAFYDRDYIARLENATQVNLVPYAPALGFLSTADDLNKAGQQILKPGFFTQESIDLFSNTYQLNNQQHINMSFGWIVTKDRFDRQFMAQIGSTIGGSSAVIVFPKQKLVVSMCSNLGGEIEELPSMMIADNFLKILDPMKDEDPNKKSQ